MIPSTVVVKDNFWTFLKPGIPGPCFAMTMFEGEEGGYSERGFKKDSETYELPIFVMLTA